MFSADRKSSRVRRGKHPSAARALGEPDWDILESFGRELQSCKDTSRQMRLVLETVRRGIGAEVAFCFQEASPHALEVLSQQALSPVWCRDFAQKLLDEAPGVDGRLLRSNLPAPADSSDPAPSSAIMVRVSESKALWIVALSFDRRRSLRLNDVQFMAQTRQLWVNQRRHEQFCAKLKGSLSGLVSCLTAAIEIREPYIRGHSERVARLAVQLGRAMGMSEPILSDLYLGGLLHDVGKLGVSEQVWQKPAPLTQHEISVMRKHTEIGDGILANIQPLAHLRPCARSHHERYDGQGYPDGLAGDAIPLLARVLAVADACVAMMSDRPHRPCVPIERLDRILAEGAGTQWDPLVVRRFLARRHELYSICRKGSVSNQALANSTAAGPQTHSGWGADPSADPLRQGLSSLPVR